MNENEYLAKTIHAQLEAGSPLVLVSIISLEGSTPRHDGTKMVVGADGKTYGTIGGSLVEAAAIKESNNILTTGKSKVLSYELNGKDVTSPGMICGGKAEIMLDYLAPSAANRKFSQQWYDAVVHGKDFYILTQLNGEGDALQVIAHAILLRDGSFADNTSLTVDDVEKLKPELHNVSVTAVLPLKDTRVIVDRIRKVKTLYCFGAGHVAVPTAHLAALVGFRVVVMDDRPEFASAERFPEAYNISVVKDFRHALEGVEIDEDSFIIIVTRGHQFDRSVLKQSLKTKAGYIGMISSKRKRAAIYQALLADGVKQERLDFVHSPIGLDIGGETPEEIAVSIVAELVSVRSNSQS